jgi:hypothetical protein
MTKKDYIAVAAVFSAAIPKAKTINGTDMWLHLRSELIVLFREDNPRFEASRFVAATEQEAWNVS